MKIESCEERKARDVRLEELRVEARQTLDTCPKSRARSLEVHQQWIDAVIALARGAGFHYGGAEAILREAWIQSDLHDNKSFEVSKAAREYEKRLERENKRMKAELEELWDRLEE